MSTEQVAVKQKLFTELEGVYSGGLNCGVKKLKMDLGYIYIPNAFSSAAVFTQNKYVASSVEYTRKCQQKNTLKAVIVNSGNANTGTGEKGRQLTKLTAKKVAQKLNLRPAEVGVSATGIIGVPLDNSILEKGIDSLLEDPYKKNGLDFSDAILTTDTCRKTAYYETKIGKKTFVVSGVTKGSGMIAPNMATTLTYLVTNAAIPQQNLQTYLNTAIEKSYNMISVDSDTSTSDMVILFSTGEHKFSLTDKQNCESFQALLDKTCLDLAMQVVRDGEGATKIIEVSVNGAANDQDARKVSKSILDSPLVKTAIYGEDPNWGRVLMAAGKADVKFNQDKLDLYFGEHLIFSKGDLLDYNMSDVLGVLKNSTVHIRLDMNINKGSAVGWGCDLTHKYVDINTDYN